MGRKTRTARGMDQRSNLSDTGEETLRKGMLAARIGFVGALVLGLGAAFGWWSVGSGAGLTAHVVLGVVFAYGIFAAAAASRGMGRTPLWVAAFLTAAAIVVALWQLFGAAAAGLYWHPILMIVAIGLAEMGAGREKRSARASG